MSKTVIQSPMRAPAGVDQGHIATKNCDFGHAIPLTPGMPILRAPADRGTATDTAGTGTVSVVGAVRPAVNFMRSR